MVLLRLTQIVRCANILGMNSAPTTSATPSPLRDYALYLARDQARELAPIPEGPGTHMRRLRLDAADLAGFARTARQTAEHYQHTAARASVVVASLMRQLRRQELAKAAALDAMAAELGKLIGEK